MTYPREKTPEAEPRWRVGKQVPVNVYEGDRPICQCHTAVDARRIVEAVNARVAVPAEGGEADARSKYGRAVDSHADDAGTRKQADRLKEAWKDAVGGGKRTEDEMMAMTARPTDGQEAVSDEREAVPIVNPAGKNWEAVARESFAAGRRSVVSEDGQGEAMNCECQVAAPYSEFSIDSSRCPKHQKAVDPSQTENKTFLYHVGEAFRAGERAGLLAGRRSVASEIREWAAQIEIKDGMIWCDMVIAKCKELEGK